MGLRILAISGSLRAGSSNTALLRALPHVVGPPFTIDLYQGLGSLPHFNPDVEEDALPESVADLRSRVQAADAIVISSPEYAHGVPGALKNALDWLVGGVELPGKRIALFNPSPRATHAQESLRETLSTMAAVVVPEASIVFPLQGRGLDEMGIASDQELGGLIRAAMAALLGKRWD